MIHFGHAPFLRLLLPLAVGILAGIFLPNNLPEAWLILIFFTGIAVFLLIAASVNRRYRYRWTFGFVLHLALFVTGYILSIYNNPKSDIRHFSRTSLKGTMVLKIADEPVEKEKSVMAVVSVESIKNNGWGSFTGKAVVSFAKDSISQLLSYGDLIIADVMFSDVKGPQNPSEFNYRQHLAFRGIYHQGFLATGKWRKIRSGEGNPIITFAHSLRRQLLYILKKHNIEGEEFAVASALLLGYTDAIDFDLRQAYAGAGVMHVLSVSGLHVGIIYIVINSLLFFLNRYRNGKIIKAFIIISLLWLYAMITGLSPSVLRAATMFSFLVVGQTMKRYTNIYNTLAASAFFLLAINPCLIMDVGFQLSYVAVLSIVIIQPALSRIWEPDNWFADQAWGIITVSIAAQIGTLPLCLYYFHQFPNYFLLANLIVIPATTFIIYFGVALFVIQPVQWLAAATAKIFIFMLSLLNSSVKFIEQLPFSLLQGISISTAEMCLMYLIIILFIAFFTFKRLLYMKGALAAAIIFTGLQIFENYQSNNQRQFIVYNIPGAAAYEFVDGRKIVFFADSSLLNDEKRIQFHVRQNWWNMGIEDIQMKAIGNDYNMGLSILFARENLIQFHDKKIAIVDNDIHITDVEEKISVDYLVFSKNPDVSLKSIARNITFKIIIFDSSNGLKNIKKWLAESAQTGIKCYSVRHSGAFVEDI